MKRALAALLIMLATMSFAGLTHAGGPPLALEHTLRGHSQGDTSMALNYTLHVQNTGDAAVTEVSLSLVALPPLRGTGQAVNVGYLGAHESIDVPVQVVTPMHLDPAHDAWISGTPLFWAGKCVDSAGNTLEFPARSVEGGAK